MKTFLIVALFLGISSLAHSQLIIGGIAGGTSSADAYSGSSTGGLSAAIGSGLSGTASGADGSAGVESSSSYSGAGGWNTSTNVNQDTNGYSLSGSLGSAGAGSGYLSNSEGLGSASGGVLGGGLLVFP